VRDTKSARESSSHENENMQEWTLRKKRLKALEDENARLKRLAADLTGVVSFDFKRRAVRMILEEGLGEVSQACRAMSLN
jgi:hypothetical protein